MAASAGSSNIKGERVILGIDPGTRLLGYAIIKQGVNHPELLIKGVLQLDKITDPYLKLDRIFKRILQLIEEYLPDELAIEAPFFGQNVQSMLKLGRAQGVAMAAALTRDIPIVEYAPKKIKQSITGNGNASKEQVAAMLPNLIPGLKLNPDSTADETDALAVALTHYFGGAKRSLSGKAGGKKGWGQFVKENPDRLK